MTYEVLPATDGVTVYNAVRDQHIQDGIAAIEAAALAAIATLQAADATTATAITALQAADTAAAGTVSALTSAALLKADNLAGLASPSAARTALGLGGSAVLPVGTTAGTVAAGDDARITGALQPAGNLAGLASPAAARTALGLGGAAVLPVGTGVSTVAAGDDSRITGAAANSAVVHLTGAETVAGVKTFSSSPVVPTATALDSSTKAGSTAYVDAAVGVEASRAGTAEGLRALRSANLSDLGSPTTARTNLGLGISTSVPSEGDALLYDGAAGVYKPRKPDPGFNLAFGLPPVTSRALVPASDSFGSGAGQQVMTRLRHYTLFDIEEFRLVYVNGDSLGGPINKGTFDLRVGVESVFGLFRQVTFNGRVTVTVPPGAIVVSDPIGWAIAGPGNGNPSWASTAFQYFFTRTFVTLDGSGGKTPRIEAINTSIGDACETGTGLTDKTISGTVGTSGVDPYGPAAIVGVPSFGRHSVVFVAGDSIAAGTGDTPTVGTPGGYIMRALYAAKIGTARHAVASQQASALANMDNTGVHTGFHVTMPSLTGCSHAICQYGFNDMGTLGNQTAAATEARLVLAWLRLGSRGAKVFQTTITPNSTSTDSWATTGNQTTTAWNSERIALNDWLRAGAPINSTTRAPVAIGTGGALLAGSIGHPLTGYFEAADIAESARNSGIWKAGYTADGTHPSTTGATAMSAAITIPNLTV